MKAKIFQRTGISKAAKAARVRNFKIYRLNGMMGNLAQMRYESRNNEMEVILIEKAMDAIHALKTYTKESEKEPEIISINTAYLLHGPSSETYHQ